MRVIKDNSNKEIKVKCKNCKSKIAVKRIEIRQGAIYKYVDCPVCKNTIWID